MKKTSTLVTTLCEVGIFAALGFVFDELQGIISKSAFPNGGSIGFAMIAVIIIAYRRGVLAALLTGLIMGIFDVMGGAYIVHPVQLLLDYVLPYTFVGLIGFLKPFFDKYNKKSWRLLWLISGVIIGGLLKFLCHYIAGVIFWSDPSGWKWEDCRSMSAWLYCFVYNIAFIGPSIVITCALAIPLYIKAPRLFIVKETKPEMGEVTETKTQDEKEEKNPFPMVLSIATMVFGTFVFIFYLIKYIKSFYGYEEGSAVGYEFDQDSMLIFIMGLFLVILGINNLIKYLKDKFTYVAYTGVLMVFTVIDLVYCVARLIRMYVKEKDPFTYWVWLVIAILLLAGSLTWFIISLCKQKKEKESQI